jgi:RNA polymerase sigma-70 factor (ECF subfamily)
MACWKKSVFYAEQVAFLKNISSNAAGEPDDKLIAAYRSTSDLKIVAGLYQRYLELLYGVCLKYLGEPESAKDAVMELFEELAQKLLKHEVEHFKGWLYTLAKNHCLMKLRRLGKARVQTFDLDNMQTAEESHLKDKAEQEERFDQLSACIEALPPDQRTAIQLFYLQDKCYKEIETATGMAWNKVRSHIQNGRRNLKICMQQKDPAMSAAAATKATNE